MGKKQILSAALLIFVGAAFFFALKQGERAGGRDPRPGFIGTRGATFTLDGKPFRFAGANISVEDSS